MMRTNTLIALFISTFITLCRCEAFDSSSLLLLDEYERILVQRQRTHKDTTKTRMVHSSPRMMETGAKAVMHTVVAVEHALIDAVREEVDTLFQDNAHPHVHHQIHYASTSSHPAFVPRRRNFSETRSEPQYIPYGLP